MQHPTLEFLDDFPLETEKEVRRMIEPMLRLVSRDLSKIRFKISDEPQGEAMIQVQRRYHVAHLWFGHKFFFLPEEEQKEILVHELTHVLVDVLHKDIHQMLDAYFEEGSSERILIESRFEDSAEKLTDSVALAFHDILKELEETQKAVIVESHALLGDID